jgi:hypothetical protein
MVLLPPRKGEKADAPASDLCQPLQHQHFGGRQAAAIQLFFERAVVYEL